MASSAVKKEELKQREITQAVVIADNFDNRFHPLSSNKPSVLFPVANKPLLEYVFQSLEECEIQETFLFCCSHSQDIREYISSSRWSSSDAPMCVTVISSASFMSMGDALRELDAKALIRSDFVLIKGDVITTFSLQDILEEHKVRKQVDKGCAMTLIYRKALPNHKIRCKEDDLLVAVDSNKQRIRFYQRTNNNKTLHIPLEVFQECEEVTVHYDLLDSHVSICSNCVPPLFSDNFDYQSLDDLIKGLIVNEELLGNSIYIKVVDMGYGASVSSFYMYDVVSQDVMGRWTYPLVPDMYKRNGFVYSHKRHNIYRGTNVEIGSKCILQENVVLGEETKIGDNSFISNSVIGANCVIGEGVSIKGSYLWDNVTINDACILENCLLAENVTLHKNVKVAPACIIGPEVIISEGVVLNPLTRLQRHKTSSDDEFGDEDEAVNASSQNEGYDVHVVGENGCGYLCTPLDDNENNSNDIWGKPNVANELDEDSEDTSSSVILSGADENSGESDNDAEDEDDDTILFYKEVLDSLQRAVEEKVKSENIILEINSSKYAYNVTMKEVNMLVMKAILKLPLQEEQNLTAQQYLMNIKRNLTFFQPLLTNYIKSVESQMNCLSSIEEFMSDNYQLASTITKILHFLYDKDILNESVILKWFQGISPDNENIRTQVSTFIQWLEEADEESSD